MITTIEQSKRLLSLGLRLRTADAWYINGSGNPHPGKWSDHSHDDDDIPAWSLSALLELMPGEIQYYSETFHEEAKAHFTLNKGSIEPIVYTCSYDFDFDASFEGFTPLEAVYNMLVWLLKDSAWPKELGLI